MNNIFILRNEIENTLDKLVADLKATDDEKIIALQLALLSAYQMKNTRMAYMSKIVDKEENTDGNSDEKR